MHQHDEQVVALCHLVKTLEEKLESAEFVHKNPGANQHFVHAASENERLVEENKRLQTFIGRQAREIQVRCWL